MGFKKCVDVGFIHAGLKPESEKGLRPLGTCVSTCLHMCALTLGCEAFEVAKALAHRIGEEAGQTGWANRSDKQVGQTRLANRLGKQADQTDLANVAEP